MRLREEDQVGGDRRFDLVRARASGTLIILCALLLLTEHDEGVCGQLAVPTSVFTDDMLRAKLPKGDFHIHFSPPCQELSVARGAKDDEAARDAQAVVAWCGP